MARYRQSDPAVDNGFFAGTASAPYWSATSDPADGAFAVTMDAASGAISAEVKTGALRARWVRGGQIRVEGNLVIVNPVQGSGWKVNDTMAIEWEPAGLGGNVAISISRDGGLTFETLAASTENDGAWEVVVAGTASDNCVLRIVPENDTDRAAALGLFTITAGELPAATVAGAPHGDIYATEAVLTVGGNDIVAYRYELDGGGYGAEIAVKTPISLSGLSAGAHTVSVIGKNGDGVWQDTGSATSVSWIVDTAVPAAPSGPDLDAADDTAARDYITSKTNGLTFTGTGEEGAVVQLFEDGTAVAGGVGTVVVGGTFAIDMDLSPGEHTITARQSDAAGNISDLSTGITVTVDNSVAVPAGLDLAAEDDTGPDSADNVTANTTDLTVTGTGEEGAAVQLYDDGTPIDNAVDTVAGGTFTIDIPLSEGSSNITAVQTDPAGNVSNVSALLSVTIDTVPPEVAVTFPTDEAYEPEVNYIEGTSSDASSDVAEIQVMVMNLSGKYLHYYDTQGGYFSFDSTTEEWHTALGTDQWTFYTFDVNFLEGVVYTVTAKSLDMAGNEGTIVSTFTYGDQPIASSITCNLDTTDIVIGQPVVVSGQIITTGNLPIGEDVQVDFFAPGSQGDSPTGNAVVNADDTGHFSYTVECGIINEAATWATPWRIRTKWSGIPASGDQSAIAAAESPDQTLRATKADSRLTLDATSQAIKLGETVTISGKLTSEPDCGGGLLGLVIDLTIVPPVTSTSPPDFINVETIDEFGHFKLENYEGFSELGTYTIYAQFDENEGYGTADAEPLTLKVVETAGYAIIVQGKINSGEGLDSHKKTSNFVYNKLLERGILPEDIRYFNHSNDSGNFPALDEMVESQSEPPSKSAIQDAIETWARDKMDAAYQNPGPEEDVTGKAANLYIILVDHGIADEFYVNDTETITSVELASWVGNLQASLTGQAAEQEIITILGFCHSGSFIDEMSGPNRVIVTSAASDEVSFKGPNEPVETGVGDSTLLLRDGEYFITGFFENVSLGKSIKEAFEDAVAETEMFTAFDSGSANALTAPYFDQAYQHPMLDDNGDGVGTNDLKDPSGDGSVSKHLFIGVSELTGNDPGDVSVTEVTDTVFLSESQTSVGQLLAQVSEDTRLLTIWVEIKPPDVIPSQTSQSFQVELDLERIVYHSSEGGVYEWL